MKVRQGILVLGMLIVLVGVFVAVQRCYNTASKIPFCNTPPPWSTDVPIRMATAVGLHEYNLRVYKGKQDKYGMPLSSDVTCRWARVVAWRERHEEHVVGTVKPERATIVREILMGCSISSPGATNDWIIICYSDSTDDSNWRNPAHYDSVMASYRIFKRLPSREEVEKNLPHRWRWYQGRMTGYPIEGGVVRTHIVRRSAFLDLKELGGVKESRAGIGGNRGQVGEGSRLNIQQCIK